MAKNNTAVNETENRESDLFQMRNGRYILSEELSEKMYYIKKTQPESYQADNSGYSWDESGMAELFSECYENDTRYCPENKTWYTYDNGYWKKDIGALLVSEKIKEFVRLMSLYCGEIVDDDKRKEYSKFISKMGDRRFRDRLMKDATGVKPIPAAKFDANPNLINCLNGTYDLEKMEFRPHDWRDFLTMVTNFEYTTKEDVRCERWERFIDEITSGDKEKADYLQRAMGYSMLGVSKEECMFILHGKTTRNGKSTFLGTIHHLLGNYATVSPVSIICKSDRAKNAEAASPTIAALKGKRFVSMAESNQYGKLDEEVIKQLTGGEEITARNLYESMMTFLPQFTLWLSCNDLPAVQDKSLFASDRVRVIEFNRHFSESERDANLKEEFKTPEAMQGIFTWLLAGYFKYKRFGLTMNDKMKEVIKQYEKDNDLVLQFIEERCRASETGSRTKTLYDAYKLWCKSNGYFVCSAKKFSAGLEQHPEKHQGKVIRDGYPFYKGIELKQP